MCHHVVPFLELCTALAPYVEIIQHQTLSHTAMEAVEGEGRNLDKEVLSLLKMMQRRRIMLFVWKPLISKLGSKVLKFDRTWPNIFHFSCENPPKAAKHMNIWNAEPAYAYWDLPHRHYSRDSICPGIGPRIQQGSSATGALGCTGLCKVVALEWSSLAPVFCYS